MTADIEQKFLAYLPVDAFEFSWFSMLPSAQFQNDANQSRIRLVSLDSNNSAFVNAVYCRNGLSYLITVDKAGGGSSKIYTSAAQTPCEDSNRVAIFKDDMTILHFVPLNL